MNHEAMLHTKDLPDAKAENDAIGSALVIAGGQIIGGAVVLGSPDYRYSECWAVGDLKGTHWAELVQAGAATVRPTAPGTSAVVRATLERFAAFADRALDREHCKRLGAIEAMATLAASRR